MATVGLKFDLDPWRKGVRSAGQLVRQGLGPAVLRPFDRAVRGSVRALRTAFARVGGFIKGVLTSALAPLIALVGVAAAIRGIQRALTGSLAAFREYDDSVTTLRASLETLGRGVDTSAAERSVKDLGDQLRLAMGITGAEVNRVFSTLVTRGFDTSQARQLTILAANYAKSTGRPLEDVTKRIADAATGSTSAMRDLGVQIAATGDRVRDGEAAVLALKSAYGDIGSDLANPSERLAAAWNALAVSLGEKISPIIEPIVEGFSDFVTGLSETEEGQIMLEKVADTLRSIVEWTGRALRFVSNFSEVVKGTAQVVWHYVRQLVHDIVNLWLDTIGRLPTAKFVLRRLGFDPEALREEFQAGADEARAAVDEAARDLMRTRDRMRHEGDGAVVSGLREVMEAGRREREEAIARLGQEMAATRNQTFAGRTAHEREAARGGGGGAAGGGMERGRAEVERRARGFGGAEAGQRVSVQIVSTRPDRFRKARFA